MAFLPVIVLMCCVLEISSEIVCDEGISSKCVDKIYNDGISEDHAIFYEEELLIQYCSDILQDFQCRLDYLQSCDPNGVDEFLTIAGGVNDIFQELCNESSDLRKNHRLYNRCLSNLTTEFDNCFVEVIVSFHEPTVTDESSNDKWSENVGKGFCSKYDPFKQCVSAPTLESCGEDATNYLMYMVEVATRRYLDANCNEL